jgi:hypothetical protein
LNDLQQSDLSWNKKNSKNQIKLRDYLISIGIKKPFKTQDNGNFKFRSLTGNETRTIFKKIDLESLFPDLKNLKKKSELWKMFPQMISCFKLRKHGVNQAQIIKEK